MTSICLAVTTQKILGSGNSTRWLIGYEREGLQPKFLPLCCLRVQKVWISCRSPPPPKILEPKATTEVTLTSHQNISDINGFKFYDLVPTVIPITAFCLFFTVSYFSFGAHRPHSLFEGALCFNNRIRHAVWLFCTESFRDQIMDMWHLSSIHTNKWTIV